MSRPSVWEGQTTSTSIAWDVPTVSSQIALHRSRIQRRHYVRNATADNHWFDFAYAKLERYRSRFGDDFCLVVNGSDARDDAYILPFRVARRVFTPKAVDHRGRWIGTIVDDVLRLSPSGASLNVGGYHNPFQLLGLEG